MHGEVINLTLSSAFAIDPYNIKKKFKPHFRARTSLVLLL